MPPVRGSCLCGGIAFEITGPLMAPMNCHCSQCRKQHGAAFRSRVRIAASDLRWLKGEHLLKFYESPRGYQRGFCRECGSPIINRAGPNWKPPAEFPVTAPQYGIPLAVLDDPLVRPELHCFVASKAPWFEITDDLPQYAGYPPASP
ncbi:MAG: GFA family protein [Xanthobacteraceae bacterium]